MKEEISIKSSIDELPVLAGKIEALGEKWDLPMPLTMNLNLVLEEAISNIVFYAFPDKAEQQTVNIDINYEKGEIEIVIKDNGIPFDPTAKEKPDIDLPADQRPIGGLGIFLITKIMDSVNYKRDNDKNILILKKKI
ncbi:MAG: ATP-binding protein [Prolixibacteraceae bacterium]|nr:ATP-binding protein [Prolixibacteraceae bacterium]